MVTGAGACPKEGVGLDTAEQFLTIKVDPCVRKFTGVLAVSSVWQCPTVLTKNVNIAWPASEGKARVALGIGNFSELSTSRTVERRAAAIALAGTNACGPKSLKACSS